jgi:hypothetical protein
VLHPGCEEERSGNPHRSLNAYYELIRTPYEASRVPNFWDFFSSNLNRGSSRHLERLLAAPSSQSRTLLHHHRVRYAWRLELRPPAGSQSPGSQSCSRKALIASTAASYRLSAVTSTECCNPSESVNDTRHVLAGTIRENDQRRQGFTCRTPLLRHRLAGRELRNSSRSWRCDETYVPRAGKWTYLYRAVDSTGATIDFLFSARRDASSAKSFFQKALRSPPPGRSYPTLPLQRGAGRTLRSVDLKLFAQCQAALPAG